MRHPATANFVGNLRRIMDSSQTSLSQTDLAAQVGISKSYMNDLIKARRLGGEDLRRKIAQALAVDYELMVKDDTRLVQRLFSDILSLLMVDIYAMLEEKAQIPQYAVDDMIGFQAHGLSPDTLYWAYDKLPELDLSDIFEDHASNRECYLAIGHYMVNTMFGISLDRFLTHYLLARDKSAYAHMLYECFGDWLDFSEAELLSSLKIAQSGNFKRPLSARAQKDWPGRDDTPDINADPAAGPVPADGDASPDEAPAQPQAIPVYRTLGDAALNPEQPANLNGPLDHYLFEPNGSFDQHSFGLLVPDSAMSPTADEGDIALVEPAAHLEPGKLCLLIRMQDQGLECLLRRYFLYGNMVVLRPDNPSGQEEITLPPDLAAQPELRLYRVVMLKKLNP